MPNLRKHRVVNGANGLFVRLVDITEADGSTTAGIRFVCVGASKFDLEEATIVRAMCELHAARFNTVAWQGKFKIKEARS